MGGQVEYSGACPMRYQDCAFGIWAGGDQVVCSVCGFAVLELSGVFPSQGARRTGFILLIMTFLMVQSVALRA